MVCFTGEVNFFFFVCELCQFNGWAVIRSINSFQCVGFLVRGNFDGQNYAYISPALGIDRMLLKLSIKSENFYCKPHIAIILLSPAHLLMLSAYESFP